MLLCHYGKPFNKPFIQRFQTTLVVLLVLSCFASNGITALGRRPPNYEHDSLSQLSLSSNIAFPPTLTAASTTNTLIRMRGGSSFQSDPIELNPDYHRYVESPVRPTSTVRHNAYKQENEHDVWLREQNQQSASFVYRRQTRSQPSIIERTSDYLTMLYSLSPSLFWTTTSCVGIFILWQLPALTPHWSHQSILHHWCINSRANCKRTFGLSLILSSLSHMSPYHLLANLLSFSHLGPSVKTLLSQYHARPRLSLFRHQYNMELWPLLLSSAIISNGLFLVASPKGASSLGLSGVTATLLAILARAYPDRRFGMVVGVVPISLSAQHLLQASLLLSMLGWWSSSFSSWKISRLHSHQSDNIAHLVHLGGLLYGIFYYEMVLLRLTPRQIGYKLVRFLRSSK